MRFRKNSVIWSRCCPTLRGVRVGHTEFIAGTLDGCDVVLAGAGMGKVNSALVTTVLADRFGCSAIVFFSGVAGGLDPELAVATW